jgi:outer membrane protein assembly factor BamB
VDAHYPEEEYRGMFAEHGYASHTPVSDGKQVFVFFGKTGLYAFDLDGKEQWHKQLGTGVGSRGWGTSSSPILYKDMVIVTASAESQSLVALKKENGEQVWKQEADGLVGTWGTPVLVEVDNGRTDLVIGVPREIWGLNPDTGKLRWFCEACQDDSYCSSVVASGDTVFAIEGRSGGSYAVKAGGKDDVTKSHMVWSGSGRNRIGTPVVADGKVYFIAGKVINCVDAGTGEEIYQSRLSSKSGAAAPQPGAGGGGGFGGGGFGGGGGGRGGMGGQDYSSPVIGDGKLYYVARNGEIFVVKLGSSFEQLAANRLTDETEDFSASPAISDNQILIRSSKHLYCVSAK